jgi:hypothetical protein
MAVTVGVDFGKEAVELGVGHGKTRAAQCAAQFLFGELAVAVVVDASEER